MLRLRKTAAGAAALIAASVFQVPQSAVANGCAPSDHPAGSWPSLNHDLSNTRSQPLETAIGVENVDQLAVSFVYRATANGGQGPFQATPTVANGCVYVASGVTNGSGGIFAFNADTGAPVWNTNLPGGALGTTVEDGRLFVGSYSPSFDLRAQALDANTGEQLWITDRLTAEGRRADGEVIHASPVVFDGMYFVAVSRGIGESSRPPLYLLDVETGDVIKKILVVGDEEHAQGFTGAGIWSTAAVDTQTKTLYAATADSEAFKSDGRYNNAIIAIDVDRNSDTFGEVLGSYKGETEHYVDGVDLYDQPACEMFGHIRTGTSPSSSLTCLELDLDFGASVNLFENSEGRTVVGALQKSGVYHAVYADSMERAWRLPMSPPSPQGNASTAAVDANGVYATANPNLVASLGLDDGIPQWQSASIYDAIRYQPISVANGVVYTVSTSGMLMAFDAETGVPLVHRSMAADAGEATCSTQGSGVAIARNTIYAQCDSPGVVIAYKLPA